MRHLMLSALALLGIAAASLAMIGVFVAPVALLMLAP